MGPDERNIVDLLKEELSFIEQGGYGRSVRTPWQGKSVFQDSLTCINNNAPKRIHQCNECHLLDFVAPENRNKDVPCHFIPLNSSGDTINYLQTQDNQPRLERQVSGWLRKTIEKLSDK